MGKKRFCAKLAETVRTFFRNDRSVEDHDSVPTRYTNADGKICKQVRAAYSKPFASISDDAVDQTAGAAFAALSKDWHTWKSQCGDMLVSDIHAEFVPLGGNLECLTVSAKYTYLEQFEENAPAAPDAQDGV